MKEKEGKKFLAELKEKYTIVYKGNGTKIQENQIFFDVNDEIINGFKFYVVYQKNDNPSIFVVLPIP